MARNLTPAHQLGMATVLVAEKDANADEAMHMPEKYRQHDAAHIDVTTDNLAQFLAGISTAA
jgi:hypothetical protein